MDVTYTDTETIAERRLIHIALRVAREGLLPGYLRALQEAAILLNAEVGTRAVAALTPKMVE